MTTVPIPPVPTPTQGPVPGDSVATAGAMSASMYSTPVPLFMRNPDVTANEGLWLRFTATQSGTVLVDTLLSVQGETIVPKIDGISGYACLLYTGPAQASTEGQLTYQRVLSALSEESLEVTAGQTYFFRFLPSDSRGPIFDFVHPQPWYVVLRISSYSFLTDWIDPPAGTIFIGPGSSANASRDYHPAVDYPNTLLDSSKPTWWNTSTADYTRAKNDTITARGSYEGYAYYGADVHPGKWEDQPDIGGIGSYYQTVWDAACYRDGFTGSYAQPSPAQPATIAAQHNDTQGVVGWEFGRKSKTFPGGQSISAEVYARTLGISLVNPLSAMGPCANYRIEDAREQAYAAGYLSDPSRFQFESQFPELLNVELSPDEAAGNASLADRCTVEWYVSSALSMSEAGDWGPASNPAGGTSSVNYGWLEGGSGVGAYAGRAQFLSSYAGGDIGWFPVDPGIWQTGLANELAVYHSRLAGGSTTPWAKMSAIEAVCLPEGFASGTVPTPVIPPGTKSGTRGGCGVVMRLTVKPSRFKMYLLPQLEPATPTYPTSLLGDGTIGTSRRTFGRPSEANE